MFTGDICEADLLTLTGLAQNDGVAVKILDPNSDLVDSDTIIVDNNPNLTMVNGFIKLSAHGSGGINFTNDFSKIGISTVDKYQYGKTYTVNVYTSQSGQALPTKIAGSYQFSLVGTVPTPTTTTTSSSTPTSSSTSTPSAPYDYSYSYYTTPTQPIPTAQVVTNPCVVGDKTYSYADATSQYCADLKALADSKVFQADIAPTAPQVRYTTALAVKRILGATNFRTRNLGSDWYETFIDGDQIAGATSQEQSDFKNVYASNIIRGRTNPQNRSEVELDPWGRVTYAAMIGDPSEQLKLSLKTNRGDTLATYVLSGNSFAPAALPNLSVTSSTVNTKLQQYTFTHKLQNLTYNVKPFSKYIVEYTRTSTLPNRNVTFTKEVSLTGFSPVTSLKPLNSALNQILKTEFISAFQSLSRGVLGTISNSSGTQKARVEIPITETGLSASKNSSGYITKLTIDRLNLKNAFVTFIAISPETKTAALPANNYSTCSPDIAYATVDNGTVTIYPVNNTPTICNLVISGSYSGGHTQFENLRIPLEINNSGVVPFENKFLEGLKPDKVEAKYNPTTNTMTAVVKQNAIADGNYWVPIKNELSTAGNYFNTMIQMKIKGGVIVGCANYGDFQRFFRATNPKATPEKINQTFRSYENSMSFDRLDLVVRGMTTPGLPEQCDNNTLYFDIVPTANVGLYVKDYSVFVGGRTLVEELFDKNILKIYYLNDKPIVLVNFMSNPYQFGVLPAGEYELRGIDLAGNIHYRLPVLIVNPLEISSSNIKASDQKFSATYRILHNPEGRTYLNPEDETVEMQIPDETLVEKIYLNVSGDVAKKIRTYMDRAGGGTNHELTNSQDLQNITKVTNSMGVFNGKFDQLLSTINFNLFNTLSSALSGGFQLTIEITGNDLYEASFDSAGNLVKGAKSDARNLKKTINFTYSGSN